MTAAAEHIFKPGGPTSYEATQFAGQYPVVPSDLPPVAQPVPMGVGEAPWTIPVSGRPTASS